MVARSGDAVEYDALLDEAGDEVFCFVHAGLFTGDVDDEVVVDFDPICFEGVQIAKLSAIAFKVCGIASDIDDASASVVDELLGGGFHANYFVGADNRDIERVFGIAIDADDGKVFRNDISIEGMEPTNANDAIDEFAGERFEICLLTRRVVAGVAGKDGIAV